MRCGGLAAYQFLIHGKTGPEHEVMCNDPHCFVHYIMTNQCYEWIAAHPEVWRELEAILQGAFESRQVVRIERSNEKPYLLIGELI